MTVWTTPSLGWLCDIQCNWQQCQFQHCSTNGNANQHQWNMISGQSSSWVSLQFFTSKSPAEHDHVGQYFIKQSIINTQWPQVTGASMSFGTGHMTRWLSMWHNFGNGNVSPFYCEVTPMKGLIHDYFTHQTVVWPTFYIVWYTRNTLAKPLESRDGFLQPVL